MKAKPSNTVSNTKTKRQEPRPPRKITHDYLRNAGVYYLQRYASTTSRFKDVMMQKIKKSIKEHGEPSLNTAMEWLDSVTADFVRLGYLNDAEFAKSFARGLKNKGLSSRKIEMKLAERGVTLPDDQEIDDLAQILKHLKRKRMGAFATKTEDAQKTLARLARQGFSFAVCQKALQMSADEIEEHLNTAPLFD